MQIKDKQLDNPVWNALTETHSKFALKYNGVKFYHPNYCPFGDWVKSNEMAKVLMIMPIWLIISLLLDKSLL